ncbi:MAG: ATP-binding protein [Acidobacteria bacterium]|nr:ATP-binding protein [Acidobacteriota bacterium]
MKDFLNVGHKFGLPLDLVTRTLAIIAIRGWGKTIAATVIAEEMCEAGLPWVAIDPVGVWWGLRVNPDGSPGGYPVVILGGEHGDLPLEKSAGAAIARAIVEENVSCVIDMSSESKNTVRHFVAEFCDRLMELRPDTPRHVFIEEAPELVPQKPMGEQKRSLAAVDRLVRLGRNRGYGATLISQRTATIQKDVLTQCENLLAGRSIGKPDRTAMKEWIAEVVGVPAPTDADRFVGSLAGLPSGTGWFWSPQWLNIFKQVEIRRRKTYHPGETRTIGERVKQVRLLDVRDFVERFREVLSTPAEQRKRPTVEDSDDMAFKEMYEAEKRRADNLAVRVAELEMMVKQTIKRHPEAKPAPPAAIQGNGSMDEIYGYVRQRLLSDPQVLKVAVEAPEIELTVSRPVLEADNTSLRGRLAHLIADKFFDSAATGSAAWTELKRRGFPTSKPNVYNELDRLAKMGFFYKTNDGYQMVEGTKIRVRHVAA